MVLTQTTQLTAEQKCKIFEIWNAEYPAAINFKIIEDLEAFLSKLGNPTHHFILDDKSSLIGWLCTFDREGSRWFVMLVNSQWQKKGVGTRLIKSMQLDEKEVSGWIAAKAEYLKNDGSLYKIPAPFYEALGFQITSVVKDTVIATRKIVWSKP